MKVMRLLSSLKHDESERGIFHLGRALVKNGHTSIIVSSADESNDLVRRLKRDGNHYHQVLYFLLKSAILNKITITVNRPENNVFLSTSII